MSLTNVQGATRALVQPLNASGVEALLLSTDERVKALSVPSVFTWWDVNSGASTIVLYEPRVHSSLNASDAITVPHLNHFLLIDRFFSTNGSHISPEVVLSHLAHVQAQFPHAEVAFSTVDEFVAQLLNHSRYGRVELPEVTAELGSSSVVGVANDPPPPSPPSSTCAT